MKNHPSLTWWVWRTSYIFYPVNFDSVQQAELKAIIKKDRRNIFKSKLDANNKTTNFSNLLRWRKAKVIAFSFKKYFLEKIYLNIFFKILYKHKMYNRNEQKITWKILQMSLCIFFTGVIKMFLVIIKHKEMVWKKIDITGEIHNGK